MIHYIRIFDFAVVEIVATILVAIWMAWISLDPRDYKKLFWHLTIMYISLLIMLSVVVHENLGINTKLMWMLNLSKCPPDPSSLTGIYNCSNFHKI